MKKNKKKKVCFFAKVENEDYLSRVGFYRQDIQILRDLDYEVETSISLRSLSLNCDFYYVWWWTWAFIPLLLGIIRRKPVIISGVFDHYIDGQIQDYPNRNFIHKILIFLSLKFCTKNIFISNLENELVKKYFGPVKSDVSYLAIETSKYSRDDKVERVGGFIFTISWLSKSNAKRKKLFEIIRSMPLILEKIPYAKLVIAGKKHDAFDDLFSLVCELNLENHVSFTDSISEEEKIDYLRKCNVYLQPTEVEGFGLAILEAMSCGAPVISSYTGTVPEVVENSALFVDHTSVKDIANQTIMLIEDIELTKKISSMGALRAKQFSYERRLIEMKKILDSIIKN